MYYWILSAILAFWVAADAYTRSNNVALWGIGAFIAGPIVIPIYCAKRHLNDGEQRKGGTGWIFAKVFVIIWTVTSIVVTVAGVISTNQSIAATTSEVEKAGMQAGAAFGMIINIAVWIIPVFIVALIGIILRRSDAVETGPTGKLAQS
jgi:heme/copper-type cytochrome/quinol oxidase subunit 2